MRCINCLAACKPKCIKFTGSYGKRTPQPNPQNQGRRNFFFESATAVLAIGTAGLIAPGRKFGVIKNKRSICPPVPVLQERFVSKCNGM